MGAWLPGGLGLQATCAPAHCSPHPLFAGVEPEPGDRSGGPVQRTGEAVGERESGCMCGCCCIHASCTLHPAPASMMQPKHNALPDRRLGAALMPHTASCLRCCCCLPACTGCMAGKGLASGGNTSGGNTEWWVSPPLPTACLLPAGAAERRAHRPRPLSRVILPPAGQHVGGAAPHLLHTRSAPAQPDHRGGAGGRSVPAPCRALRAVE